MEGAAALSTNGDFLFELRHHAKGAIPVDDDVGAESRESVGEVILSYLSLRGVSKIKEKWSKYSRGKRRPKSTELLLFVSPSAEYVAVAAGNCIFILRKDDGYNEPCGIYTSSDRMTNFTNGAWLERQGILGITDDSSTLYLIKENGVELTRRTSNQLKIASFIFELVAVDSSDMSIPGFFILTDDGSVYQFDAMQEPRMTAYHVPVSINTTGVTRSGQLPRSISCVAYHNVLSLFVLVGTSNISSPASGYSGGFFLYLVNVTKTRELILMFQSIEFKGTFYNAKIDGTPVSSPKVLISPHGEYLATLDLTGCINIFSLDSEDYLVSLLSHIEDYEKDSDGTSERNKNHLIGFIDISWWTSDTLVMVKGDHTVAMYNVISKNLIQPYDPIADVLMIQRASNQEGFSFALSCGKASIENAESSVGHKVAKDDPDDSLSAKHEYIWNLISLSKVTISEMYSFFIQTNRFQHALEFAKRHGLDANDVLKAQWLQSDRGVSAIELYLVNISDENFVLSECLNSKVPSESSLRALLFLGLRITDKYRFSDSCETDTDAGSPWIKRIMRLKLLQFRDRLETFVGINMGRFMADEYSKFRSMTLVESAVNLSESGKIGALNLLFKQHPYTVCRDILHILSSIPETVAVQSYSQLLPGKSPPTTVILRDVDWVECEKMVCFIKDSSGELENNEHFETEIILKKLSGFIWPSTAELCSWYKTRARSIDNLSGQLDNCVALIDIACRKGLVELDPFLDEIKYLNQLVYSDAQNDFTMSLATWESYSDFEKFKIMLNAVNEETVVQRLQAMAIPFMLNKVHSASLNNSNIQLNSFVVRWMQELASENQLTICLAVFKNGCGDMPIDCLFKDFTEMVETALSCIYMCSSTDQWNSMACILTELRHVAKRLKSPEKNDELASTYTAETFGYGDLENRQPKKNLRDSRKITSDSTKSLDLLEGRLKVVDGHVEVGRLLAYYQVPKPVGFFLTAGSDKGTVEDLVHLVLSNFRRRQPNRSVSEWECLWHDMQCFQEKAFHFLDKEFMLTKFIESLLQTSKLSLAQSYLNALSIDKAESLVIQAARDYFFSATNLSGHEIYKARQCLSLLPNSRKVQEESDLIDALTMRLPNLGVTLLPVEFVNTQPMKIIGKVLASHPGAYLNYEEIIDVAKLLGLKSEDEVAAVEESVARDAAVNGDLQVAYELCESLVKKDHGAIWDLCAAIAKGPHLDSLDINTRKKLLGFALSHCDEESIGELLNAWKDFDVRGDFEQLMISTGTSPPNYSVQGHVVIPFTVQSVKDIFDLREHSSQNDNHLDFVKKIFKNVCMGSLDENESYWESILTENRKVLSFSALELPWLLELTNDNENVMKLAIHSEEGPSRRINSTKQMKAVNSIVRWLVSNGFSPSDDLILTLAKSVMMTSASDADDALGCSILLNLLDPHNGVKFIERELDKRDPYQEINSVMNVGMTYSSLNNARKKCPSSYQKRELLFQKFHKKFNSIETDDMAHTTFWKDWKAKLEEERRLTDQARALKEIIPDIETSRFLSGDVGYIKSALLSFVGSVKFEKKHILKEAVKLADTYGVPRCEVLLRFLASVLVSSVWQDNDIFVEISEFREEIVKSAVGVIEVVSSDVYPEIDGHNKQRLAYIFSILSACFLRLRTAEKMKSITSPQHKHSYICEPYQYYKILEQECGRVSFIVDLDFKNIAQLDDLNFERFNEEICKNINASTVTVLGEVASALLSVYEKSSTGGLISQSGVYKHHVLAEIASLEGRIGVRLLGNNSDEWFAVLVEIQSNYGRCKSLIQDLPGLDISYVIGKYCILCLPPDLVSNQLEESGWKENLIMLVEFWIQLFSGIPELPHNAEICDMSLVNYKKFLACLKIFKKLLLDDTILTGQGWETLFIYKRVCILKGLITDVGYFCRSMAFSGCAFDSVRELYCVTAEGEEDVHPEMVKSNILQLYGAMADSLLSGLSTNSGDWHGLLKLLSSLSISTQRCEDELTAVRSEIWAKLSTFSDDLQVDSQLRVYALELMQVITGKNDKALPPDLLLQVKPWESWHGEYVGQSIPTDSDSVSTSISSTLLALKSTQIVSKALPDANISPEDLANVESAGACISRLLHHINSTEGIGVLIALLEEWDELNIQDIKEPEDDWGNDEWGDGWENHSEEPEISAQDASVVVQPLHSSWKEVILKLVDLGKLQDVIRLLDQSSFRQRWLLDEKEAEHLHTHVVRADCFMALKVTLLLPYKHLQLQCLKKIEPRLKEGTFTTQNSKDYEFLALVLGSGLLPEIAANYFPTFDFVCSLVGHLAKDSQRDILEGWSCGQRESWSLVFERVLLPYFVSQLVVAGQDLLASFIISKWMHLHPSYGLIDDDNLLRTYLQRQLLVQSQESEVTWDGNVKYTLCLLSTKLFQELQSALSKASS